MRLDYSSTIEWGSTANLNPGLKLVLSANRYRYGTAQREIVA
jgi:hypothetical protein